MTAVLDRSAATRAEGPAVPEEVLPARHRVAPRRSWGYGRLLRLRHIHPNAWLRALFVEGTLTVGIVLALADLASAWLIAVLPLAVAVVVKFHDLVAGALARGALRDARGTESSRAPDPD